MDQTLTALGKYGSPVQVLVSVFQNGSLFATAEDEHLTENQFVNAVRKAYPDFEVVSYGRQDGFWHAQGGLRITGQSLPTIPMPPRG